MKGIIKEPSPGVFLSLDGDIISNHGYVDINDFNNPILCHTNFPPPTGSTTSGGDWWAPDGTRVSGTDVQGVTRTRDPMVVRLLITYGDPPEGIYHCIVQNITGVNQTAYVGLYRNGGKGDLIVVSCFIQILL